MIKKSFRSMARGAIGGFVLLFAANLFAVDTIKDATGKVNVVNLNTFLKQKGAKWTAGENQFSKMTLEEKKAYLGTIPSTEQIPEKQVKVLKADIPAAFDWRNKDGINWMPPIRDQKSCGSCWAFSAVGVVEALINIAENNPDLDYNLSEQTLVTCSGAGSCGGGQPIKAFSFIQSTGIPTEACDPYTASDDGCSRCTDWATQVKKISSYSSVSGANLKTVLLENPLSVTMEVYEDFYNYENGIYTYDYGGFMGYHAIVLIGWDDANSCWIARNSWGTSWGQGGYFKISYANGAAFPGAPIDANYQPSSAVVVTTPNGGEKLIKDNVYTIRWSCGATDNLNIDLYKGGVFNSTIVSGTANTGSYDWTVPTGQATGTDYKVRVIRGSAPTIYDESDNNFTITVPNITVTAPNGGENWVGSNYYSIKWTSAGVVGNVNIDLYKGGVLNSTIASNVSNNGTYNWNIPGGQAIGSDYKVRVTSINTPSLWDESDNNFNITVQNLVLTSPNGGESWTTGSTNPITWTSAGITGYIKIELYKGGVLNKTIISSTSNTGTYNWAVGTQAVGTDYKVKISSVSAPTIWDESNANFTVAAPTITVSTPNGGESWFGGTTNPITWTSSGLSGYVRIHLYKGGVYKSIITNCVSNTGTYNWAIPTTQAMGTDYKVRVISYTNAAVYDESNANFTVAGAGITVTSPNGGESWGRGNVYPITWTSAGVTGNIKIELYKAGAFKMTIISSTANTGTYNWTIPAAQLVGTDYKIKITSASNIAITDQSNANFSIIVPTTSITVSAPNGGESWLVGSAHNLTWTSSGITGNVNIALYKGGVLNSTIASDVANSGSYNWNVPTGQTAGTDYKVRVTSVSAPTVYDESNANFSITVPSVGITVTAPNGGESWAVSTTNSVTWVSSGVTGNVNIDLYKGGVLNGAIASNISNSGTYSWAISGSQATGTDYKVRVTSVSDTSVKDESNSNFSITKPNVVVTSPNGGESWLAGSSHNVTWTSSGVSGNVNIDLYKSGVFSSTLASGVSNSGTYSWAISASQTIGTDYKVRVVGVSDTSVWDESNANFGITVSGTGITVTAQNGGEVMVANTPDTVTWTSSGITGTVKIELYKAGAFNKTIASSATNSGSYVWTIASAQAPGTDYKIKITSTTNISISDMSDNNFSIVAPSITVTSPNGGESWGKGTVHNITWVSAGVSGNVIIDLYKNGSYNLRIASNTANAGTYSWTVPTGQTIATDYKVKITSYSSSTINDMSNANFSIVSVKSLKDYVVKEYKLFPAYPNPATSRITLCYQLPAKSNVSLKIYDKGGRLVKTLISGEKASGYYEMDWDKKDNTGKVLPSGVYLYRIKTETYSESKKIIL
ncbi:MAG: Ser-Thr-rich GPI-anchored membrane family protein [bacterium]